MSSTPVKSEGWTEALRWPPFTHGRVVCRNCSHVVAQCRCSLGCRIVGTVGHCKHCPAPACDCHTKSHQVCDICQEVKRVLEA